MGVTLTGGPLLVARLNSVSDVSSDLKFDWLAEATRQIKAGAPARTGHLRNSVSGRPISGSGVRGRPVGPSRVGVFADYWAVFVDRGTKAHDILPRKKTVLAFQYRGRTVFTPRAHVRRKNRRPFVTRGAQNALRAVGVGAIDRAWSRPNVSRRLSRVAL